MICLPSCIFRSDEATASAPDSCALLPSDNGSKVIGCWHVSHTYLVIKTIIKELVKVLAHVQRRSYPLHGRDLIWPQMETRIVKAVRLSESTPPSGVVWVWGSQFLTISCRPPRRVFGTILEVRLKVLSVWLIRVGGPKDSDLFAA
jgi:hypothetical protein